MNSQKYKIQSLIAEIDEVLSKPAPRLPWTGSIDTVHQRHLLERVRTYLVAQDSKLPAGKKPPSDRNLPPTPVRVPPPPPRPPQPPAAPKPSATAEQIVLAVTAEIGNLRENLTQPLQQDIQSLRQEHQALIEEIKQLEAKRQQQQSLAQQQANQQQIIAEFMQALTGKLQEAFANAPQLPGNLPPQQSIEGSTPPALAGSGLDAGRTAGEYPLLTPAQRLEQMQQFQANADSLMMRLDSTLNLVFDTLQENLQNYQESLGEGLDRMHGLGQQSEAMFAAWVNRLAEQLGRETYAYAQRPIDLPNPEMATPRAIDPVSVDPLPPETTRSRLGNRAPDNRSSEEIAEQDRFPYAGTEMSPQYENLRRDRDRVPTPISMEDLAENLFGTEPIAPITPAAEEPASEIAPETAENVEDLYASLFAAEEIAELELEPFVLENPETAAESSPQSSQTTEAPATDEESLTTEDLFANLLDEGESLGDFLAGEDSDFVIANAVEELTLDTPDLFAPEIDPSQLAEAEIPTVELPIDIRNRSAAAPEAPPQQPTAVPTTPAASPPQNRQPRIPSAQDVQTGEFGESDDFYIQASPDENLLPIIDEPEEPEDRSIDLDNSTLQQLQSDLYSLEGLDDAASGRSSVLTDFPEVSAENPFSADDAASGTLEDLFADVLEGSPSDDEAFSLEAELDAELFAEESEDPNVSLDDILASLTEEEIESDRPFDIESETVGETDSQKKKLILADEPEITADVTPSTIAPGFPNSKTKSRKGANSGWYLGIDFGTTGLSAALLDRPSGRLYPIFWESQPDAASPQSGVSQSGATFRMPPAAVLQQPAGEESALQNFKLPLKVGIPYLRQAGGDYEPMFQQSQTRKVSIAQPLQGLRALLAALHPSQQPPISGEFAANSHPAMQIPDFTCKAAGLEPEIRSAALGDLQGVILGTPAGWSD
ncbi:MAG: hypothetical protein ACRC62_27395, partial [Microcoleus sp.]